MAAARLLRSQGTRVFVSELKKTKDRKAEIDALKKTGVDFEFGGHSERVFESDLIIISPGISTKSEIVQEIQSKKIPVWSELELAARFCPGPIIAISGTNGKSTTTVMLGEMFRQAGKKHVVAGNIGYPFSDAVSQMDSETTAIIEVSSFQLVAIELFRPHIGVLLNVTPDHLDRHESFDTYLKTKLSLIKNQTEADFAIFNSEEEATENGFGALNLRSISIPFHTRKRLEHGCSIDKGRITFQFEEKRLDILAAEEIVLPGTHNLSNSLAAISAALIAGISIDAIARTLRNFHGLEHRLEFVRELSGVKYVNDSKATNLESMRAGINSFEQPLVVIAGGRDKGENFNRIQNAISKKVKKLILIGETANRFSSALQNGVAAVEVESLDEAVTEAKLTAKTGDLVLLCPGCSSFDMFEDYEDRGRQFKELVHKL